MKIDGNAIRPGMVIEHQGGLWRAVKIAHTQPGKGGAYLQVELKNLEDGTKLNERFRSAASVERVRLDEKHYQYLYSEGDLHTIMDTETYDQIALADAVVEDVLKYMKPDAEITVGFYKEEAVSVDVGNFVELEVTEAPPGFKGDTATGATKIVTFETGLETQVPLFVKEGDVIRIDTRSNSYVTRV